MEHALCWEKGVVAAMYGSVWLCKGHQLCRQRGGNRGCNVWLYNRHPDVWSQCSARNASTAASNRGHRVTRYLPISPAMLLRPPLFNILKNCCCCGSSSTSSTSRTSISRALILLSHLYLLALYKFFSKLNIIFFSTIQYLSLLHYNTRWNTVHNDRFRHVPKWLVPLSRFKSTTDQNMFATVLYLYHRLHKYCYIRNSCLTFKYHNISHSIPLIVFRIVTAETILNTAWTITFLTTNFHLE